MRQAHFTLFQRMALRMAGMIRWLNFMRDVMTRKRWEIKLRAFSDRVYRFVESAGGDSREDGFVIGEKAVLAQVF